MAVPASASAQAAPAIDDLHAILRAARDADLRADWDGLIDARQRVASSKAAADTPALTSYYLGYIEWRLSSLAYLVTGSAGMQAALERAVAHLQAATAAQPTFGEAQALLATCAGILAGADRSRIEALVKNARIEELARSARSERR